MATNIEIEAKALISEEEYKNLLEKLDYEPCSTFDQVNYYIETKHFDLKKLGVGLRIRVIDGKYVMTLKSPMSEGLLEKEETISEDQFQLFEKKNIFPECTLKDFIIMLGFEIKKLKVMANLRTHRCRFELDEGKHYLCIDKNEYNNLVDYELELEGNSLGKAKNRLEQFCIEYGIEYKDNPRSKQTRALESL
ncbi:MAG: CYTH domain-containing protein [Bacilli bacterium]|nr:CYTH domain-containing protein [Bacilli bacterium]